MATTVTRDRERAFHANVGVSERHLRGQVAGPFEVGDLVRALEADGWRPDGETPDGRLVYAHADWQWPAHIDASWENLREGSTPFRLLATEMGIPQEELVKLLKQTRPRRRWRVGRRRR